MWTAYGQANPQANSIDFRRCRLAEMWAREGMNGMGVGMRFWGTEMGIGMKFRGVQGNDWNWYFGLFIHPVFLSNF